jgi:hypothetical protein
VNNRSPAAPYEFTNLKALVAIIGIVVSLLLIAGMIIYQFAQKKPVDADFVIKFIFFPILQNVIAAIVVFSLTYLIFANALSRESNAKTQEVTDRISASETTITDKLNTKMQEVIDRISASETTITDKLDGLVLGNKEHHDKIDSLSKISEKISQNLENFITKAAVVDLIEKLNQNFIRQHSKSNLFAKDVSRRVKILENEANEQNKQNAN